MNIWPQPRDGLGMCTTPTTLEFDAERTVLREVGREPVILQVSPCTLAARHWPRGEPSPLQLERAIDDVENAIEQADMHHADRGVLSVTAKVGHLLPQKFMSSGDVGRDDVEAEFSRLVTASGSTIPGAGGAPSGEAAAALLLVREVMHHLGFQALGTDG